MIRYISILGLVLLFVFAPQIIDSTIQQDGASDPFFEVSQNTGTESPSKTSENEPATSVSRETQAAGDRVSTVKSTTEEQSPQPAPGANEPNIESPFALAVDIESGYVFYKKGRTDARWPVASISKLVTAIIVAEALEPNEHVTVTEKAIATEGIAGYLSAGDIYTAEDLMSIMLLTSSNDAAMALAEHIGLEQIGARMQDKASEIGMSKSSFVEPTGLSVHNQSTLNDLHTLMKYLYEHHREILDTTTNADMRITNQRTGFQRIIPNINYFSGYSNFLGGKTGYIDSSGENLVSLFHYKDSVIMTVVLASPDRFNETQRILDYIKAGYTF